MNFSLSVGHCRIKSTLVHSFPVPLILCMPTVSQGSHATRQGHPETGAIIVHRQVHSHKLQAIRKQQTYTSFSFVRKPGETHKAQGERADKLFSQ